MMHVFVYGEMREFTCHAAVHYEGSGRYARAMVNVCRGQRVVLFLHYAGPETPTQIVRLQQAPLPMSYLLGSRLFF